MVCGKVQISNICIAVDSSHLYSVERDGSSQYLHRSKMLSFGGVVVVFVVAMNWKLEQFLVTNEVAIVRAESPTSKPMNSSLAPLKGVLRPGPVSDHERSSYRNIRRLFEERQRKLDANKVRSPLESTMNWKMLLNTVLL
ncbi:unnamed protein product [Anisakis simplex]|uniref:Transmembrane protein n=1 Tax=Anisakis simplex TaxID=6269 RepID=A0A0M3K860_ANISI|nr:unnamed protein product [Anisakis simplex]